MIMEKVSFTIIVVCLSFVSALAAAYKWTDDEGNIHYSDRPPEKRKAQEIDATVFQSPPGEHKTPLPNHAATRSFKCRSSSGKEYDSSFPCDAKTIRQFGRRLGELLPSLQPELKKPEALEGIYHFATSACEPHFRAVSPEEMGERGEPFFPREMGAAMAKAAREIVCPKER
jgi:hypothetical protein